MQDNDALRLILDRQAILDVLHAYCRLADIQDHGRLVEEVFAVDGSDDHGGGPVHGREAIRAWFDDAVKNVAACFHNVSNVVIEIDGDRATMRSNVISWTWTRASSHLGPTRPADYALAVSYVDELSRYPEGWRIDKRVLVSNGESVLAIGELPATQRGVQALARRMS
jgi:hypothetical protein